MSSNASPVQPSGNSILAVKESQKAYTNGYFNHIHTESSSRNSTPPLTHDISPQSQIPIGQILTHAHPHLLEHFPSMHSHENANGATVSPPSGNGVATPMSRPDSPYTLIPPIDYDGLSWPSKFLVPYISLRGG